MPTEPGCVDQQRREPLHPPIQGHVVDLAATLGEEFLEARYDNPYRRSSAPPTRSLQVENGTR
jgi:hypothetical protein